MFHNWPSRICDKFQIYLQYILTYIWFLNLRSKSQIITYQHRQLTCRFTDCFLFLIIIFYIVRFSMAGNLYIVRHTFPDSQFSVCTFVLLFQTYLRYLNTGRFIMFIDRFQNRTGTSPDTIRLIKELQFIHTRLSSLKQQDVLIYLFYPNFDINWMLC